MPALITAVLFAMSAVCGRMAADRFGPLQANAIRLLLALPVLGLLTWWLNADGLDPRTAGWLVLSGVVGFGMGDVALYLALPRLGSRLTLLMNFCTAPLFAAATDFLMVGTTIRPMEAAAGALVLSGVALALMPEAMHRDAAGRLSNPLFAGGVLLGLLAGLGQGVGASLSKVAHAVGEEQGIPLTGIGEAGQRVAGGLVVALAAWGMVHCWGLRKRAVGNDQGARSGHALRPRLIGWKRPKRAWMWLLGAAFFGPVIGVSCFQLALHSAPSSLVLIVISTSPLLVIPLSRWLEQDSPRPIALLGSVIAVAGLVWLLTQ